MIQTVKGDLRIKKWPKPTGAVITHVWTEEQQKLVAKLVAAYDAYYRTPQIVGNPAENPDDTQVSPGVYKSYVETLTKLTEELKHESQTCNHSAD